jgi:hypothetical protein
MERAKRGIIFKRKAGLKREAERFHQNCDESFLCEMASGAVNVDLAPTRIKRFLKLITLFHFPEVGQVI